MYIFIILLENAARSYGLGDAELFQTIDLFEKHNIPQVTQCIFALGRNVSDTFVIIIMHLHVCLFVFFYSGTKKEIQWTNTRSENVRI
jgi:hypothetical protein